MENYVRRQASHGLEVVATQDTVITSESLGRVQPMELVMCERRTTCASATSSVGKLRSWLRMNSIPTSSSRRTLKLKRVQHLENEMLYDYE
ncbi:hypothetical protein R6Q57_008782 [Mikania cordata]